MTALKTIPERCAACYICELACSFHHEGVFGRRLSSVEIRKDAPTGKVAIAIHGAGAGRRRACDACEGEPKPLCIIWCPVSAIVGRGARP